MKERSDLSASENIQTDNAIDSLFKFLEPVQDTPVASTLDTEALRLDLDIAKVAVGASNDPLIEKLLDAHDSDGLKVKRLNKLSVEAFQELYDRIIEVSSSLNKADQQFLLEFISNKIIKLSRTNFYMYVKFMAPEILPEGFIDGRHIKLMADALQKIEWGTANGQRARQMIFCPPGAMKSKLINPLHYRLGCRICYR
jgi:hypothetical protein